MAEIEKKPIKIMETVLRDAHQSLIATRMTTEQMVPIISKMDRISWATAIMPTMWWSISYRNPLPTASTLSGFLTALTT